MKSPSSRWPTARTFSLFYYILATTYLISNVYAISYQAVPDPGLDLSGLGRVALAGNFDSISLYQYMGQDEDGLSTNGSQSLLGRYPDGGFASLQSSNGFISAMCPFVSHDGTFNGIVVGGNFTTFGGQQIEAVALFDPSKNTLTPLPGLTGQVYSVYCDSETSTVYVGGMFSGGNSTNAIAWVTGWTNLPFAGFNGPVYSINKLPNGNIVFGGAFTGIANATEMDHIGGQVINLKAASNLTVTGASTSQKYNDPASVICATPGQSAGGSTFLLQDGTPGSIQADFNFYFTPSKIRLYNSQVGGYGTRTWRFTAIPLDGILNFTFHDRDGPRTCTNQCPLGQDAEYQDYYFVNPINMNSFRIDISDWYGKGGGLGGLELFSSQIFTFAINRFNEPACDHLDSGASSSVTGDWSVAPSNASDYLTTKLDAGTMDGQGDASIVFYPHITRSGNYTILMNTPGCVPDDTCYTRGKVDVTGQLASSTNSAATPLSTTLYQTNYGPKYDQIYYGYVDATGSTFKPSITLTPSPDQMGPLTVVAQSIEFKVMSLMHSSGGSPGESGEAGGLNGLFEYDPKDAVVKTDFEKSAIDTAGNDLDDMAEVLSVIVDGETTYAAGSFESKSASNILSISGSKSSPLANGGLNDAVNVLYLDDTALYAGGNFSNTKDMQMTNLNSVAWYDISQKSWHALGAGVKGAVYSLIPLDVNTTNHGTQKAIAVSGYFDQVNAFGTNGPISVRNIALWLPSQDNWLQNVDANAIALTGQLNVYTDVPGHQPLFSGEVDSQMLGAGGVVSLTQSPSLDLQALPVMIESQQSAATSSKLKRAAASTVPSEGVITGLFYTENRFNLTILGGRFSAKASGGSSLSNLVVIDGAKNNRVTGLESDSNSNSAIYALDTQGRLLIAGGSVNGGVLVYNLAKGDLAGTQPPALSGGDAKVYAIAARPKTSEVYVGGSFTKAGSLGCGGLCVYDTRPEQWNVPGNGLSASSVVNVLEWTPDGQLLVAGELRVRGKSTAMAMYNPKTERLIPVANAHQLPGPVTAYTPVDASFTKAYVSGVSTSNNSVFLAYFDGDHTWSSVKGLEGSSRIEGLQVLGLDSDNSNLANSNEKLLVTGKLHLSKHGAISAALYDGSQFTPFALSTLSDGSPGSISQVFVENTQNLLTPSQGSHLALGFIVLIGLACALGAVFLIVVLGIAIERIRRRREGYVPAPNGFNIYEKSGGGNIGKIAPEDLFKGVGPGEGGTAGSRL